MALSGLLNAAARCASATAMPTELPMPWPSGPVVVSTPGVYPYSGWPGCSALPLSELLEVIEREVVAAQVEAAVEEHRRVAARQHEAVAVGPRRVRRIVAHRAREQHVAERRERHRRAGMAGFRLLHGVHGQRSNGVDAEEVEIARRHGDAGGEAGGAGRGGRQEVSESPNARERMSAGANIRSRF